MKLYKSKSKIRKKTPRNVDGSRKFANRTKKLLSKSKHMNTERTSTNSRGNDGGGFLKTKRKVRDIIQISLLDV